MVPSLARHRPPARLVAYGVPEDRGWLPEEGRLVAPGHEPEDQLVPSHPLKGWPEVSRALCGEHFWSPSYAVVPCGGAPLDVVNACMYDQQSPNKKPGYPKGRPRRAVAKVA